MDVGLHGINCFMGAGRRNRSRACHTFVGLIGEDSVPEKIQKGILTSCFTQYSGIRHALISGAYALLLDAGEEGNLSAVISFLQRNIFFGSVILSHLTITLAPIGLRAVAFAGSIVQNLGLLRPCQMNGSLFLQAAEAPEELIYRFTLLDGKFVHDIAPFLDKG